MAKNNSSGHNILRLINLHFLYTAAFAGYIVVYHAGNVLTLESVRQRWFVAAGMLITTTLVWYFAQGGKNNPRLFLWTLIIMDIAVASYMVYSERGMQSLGVALYAIPIVVSAALPSRRAIFATASLCTAAYSFAAIKYFTDFFNEGYKIQLYGTLAFYSIGFFILAACLASLGSAGGSKKKIS